MPTLPQSADPGPRFFDCLFPTPRSLPLEFVLMTPKVFTTAAPGKKASSVSARNAKGPITLAIDVGGSGLKAMLLDASGTSASERQRVVTPEVASPKAVLAGLDALRELLPGFD